VPLAPAFFDRIKEGGSATAQAPGPQTRTATKLATDLELDQAPSGKLLGLITLLGHYMLEGRSGPITTPRRNRSWPTPTTTRRPTCHR
jgi:hypothetical protein